MITIEDTRRIHSIPVFVPDTDVERRLSAAFNYAKNAGIEKRDDDALYDELILKLFGIYYDNIDVNMAADGRDTTKLQGVLNRYVLNLRYSDG